MKKFLLLLLLFFIAYYIFKAITRLLKVAVEKRQYDTNNHDFRTENTVNNGFASEKKKRFDKDEGDYVDFEEVK